MFSIHKFRDVAEVQLYLNGGLLGIDVSKGVAGLIGKTLSFTSPAVSACLFVAGTAPDGKLMFGDIKTQIEAAVPTVKVYQIGGQIALIHSATPITLPVALAAAVSDAKKLLGFAYNSATAGRVIKDHTSLVAPRLDWWNTTNDGSHAILIWEG